MIFRVYVNLLEGKHRSMWKNLLGLFGGNRVVQCILLWLMFHISTFTGGFIFGWFGCFGRSGDFMGKTSHPRLKYAFWKLAAVFLFFPLRLGCLGDVGLGSWASLMLHCSLVIFPGYPRPPW